VVFDEMPKWYIVQCFFFFFARIYELEDYGVVNRMKFRANHVLCMWVFDEMSKWYIVQ
jgi:hypothetical protein